MQKKNEAASKLREKLLKERKTFRRIKLESPKHPDERSGRGRKLDYRQRMGKVQVNDDKIKILIENYTKKKLKN